MTRYNISLLRFALNSGHDRTIFDLVLPIMAPNFWKPSVFLAIINRAFVSFLRYFSAEITPWVEATEVEVSFGVLSISLCIFDISTMFSLASFCLRTPLLLFLISGATIMFIGWFVKGSFYRFGLIFEPIIAFWVACANLFSFFLFFSVDESLNGTFSGLWVPSGDAEPLYTLSNSVGCLARVLPYASILCSCLLVACSFVFSLFKCSAFS